MVHEHICMSGGKCACLKAKEIQLLIMLALGCASLLQGGSNTTPAPAISLAEHSLAVTDIHVGMGGMGARVFTASLDRTCKVRMRCLGKGVAGPPAEMGLLFRGPSSDILCICFATSKQSVHVHIPLILCMADMGACHRTAAVQPRFPHLHQCDCSRSRRIHPLHSRRKRQHICRSTVCCSRRIWLEREITFAIYEPLGG